MRLIRMLLPLWFLLMPIDMLAQTDVRIPVAADVQLKGRIYYPNSTEPAPAIILLNPWSIGDWIYASRAREWAAHGFVVLAYNLRGWMGSQGEADVGGPLDMQDVSRVIDWLEENPRVDATAIGIGGVSLGAGASLLAAAHEPRIRAVAAMSGWANLYDPVYGYNTQRPFWDSVLLVGSLIGTGSFDAAHKKEIREAIAKGDYAGIHAYTDPRSPDQYLEALRGYQPAILISHNYSDILFPVDAIWRFFTALDVPKKLLLQEGVHGSTEVGGMFGQRPSDVWDGAREWFERWLKGSRFALRERTQEWSIKLGDRFVTDDQSDGVNKTNSRYDLAGHALRFGRNSGINSGIPLIYPLVSNCPLLQPPVKSNKIKSELAAVYPLFTADRDLDIIGIPRLNLLLSIQRGASVQLIAHLFRVTPGDGWNLLSMTPYTLRDVKAGQSQAMEFSLYGAFAALRQGDRLVLAIDTFDPEFSSPKTDFAFAIEPGESWIDIPFSSESGPSHTPAAELAAAPVGLPASRARP